MALDGVLLHAIQAELQQHIGSRIDRVLQPSKDEIVLVLRSKEGFSHLLLCVSANHARVHITAKPPQNPKSPPMFCMLLRKHLGGGRLTQVTQLEMDRILCMDFSVYNRLGDLVTMRLIIEIMGRHSNIILVDQNGMILDAIKRVDDEMSTVRPIAPNLQYQSPPLQDKRNLLQCSEEDVRTNLAACSALEPDSAILQTFQGVSPLLARELAQGSPVKALMRLKERLLKSQYQFCALIEDRKPKDFSLIPITQYGELLEKREFSSASELLDFYYYEKDRVTRMKQRSQELRKLLDNLVIRVTRKLQMRQADLKKAKRRDEYRVYGDLLNANLHKLKKGDKVAAVSNYYNNQKELLIPLDPKKNPAQNAQQYYHAYKKSIRAEQTLVGLIEDARQELDYLGSVQEALERTQSIEELGEIRAELVAEGYVKKKVVKGKQKTPKALPPLRFRSEDGFLILCGRNNRQNDKLTLKEAAKQDIWCHTQRIHGAHIILVTEGKEPSERALQQACIVAATYSKAKDSAQVPVDYTRVKYVKKPTGAKPGMVIFTDYQTLFVTPSEAIVEKWKEGRD